ncbi:MAPK regulated corepressor interacting protein 2 isoform X1 [Rana temporaria]|uniref:MAPK regulated corepressor interacting protein 2 isoform X1 n=1 Tax=Rana temporaria TaxID=8407 RepID=UPI001AACB43E|nr:MAPK regulated corepressor interacting protein 2 isoform X1 [Rana temporaria]
MYTITRGPSKLTTQRRTGPKQQIDTKLQELKIKQQLLINTSSSSSNGWDPLPSSCAPKLVFNRVNGKHTPSVSPPAEEEVYTPAHEENVRFVYQAWQEVQHQLEKPELNGCGPQQYQDQTTDSSPKNFVPIDLEEWWAERFLANIENCA